MIHKTLMFSLILISFALISFAFFSFSGCEEKKMEVEADNNTTGKATPAKKGADSKEKKKVVKKKSGADLPIAPKTGPLELPPKGFRFDPPTEVARVPAGAWYCDMGTVEFASSEKNDGHCPICKMRLKQKPEAEKHQDHAGHGHPKGEPAIPAADGASKSTPTGDVPSKTEKPVEKKVPEVKTP